MDRLSYQTLVTKLDLGAVTLKEAKEFAKRMGCETVGRTKEQFIRNLGKKISVN